MLKYDNYTYSTYIDNILHKSPDPVKKAISYNANLIITVPSPQKTRSVEQHIAFHNYLKKLMLVANKIKTNVQKRKASYKQNTINNNRIMLSRGTITQAQNRAVIKRNPFD
jgi:hypothetical protein